MAPRLKESIHLERPLPHLTQKNVLQNPLLFGVFPSQSVVNFVVFRPMLLSKNFLVLLKYLLLFYGVLKLQDISGGSLN